MNPGRRGRAVSLLPTAALALLLTAGCAGYRPQLDEISMPVPEAFAEAASRAAEEAAPVPEWYQDRWWESFEDPLLNELMEEAFAGNLDLAQAYARLDQLLALTRATRAAQRPAVDARGQAGRDRQPGLSGDADRTTYELSLAASYEVDLWRKLDSRTRAAELEARFSREDILALYLTLSAQLADLYYLAVEQRAQLELTDRTIASFEEALERVERRYRAGLVPSLDVYQARQNLAAVKARRPQFEATLAEIRHALAVLLGRFPDQETGGELSALPDAPVPLPAVLPSELVARRPDIRAAFGRIEADDARVAAAVADRFPSFNLFATLGLSRTVVEAGAMSGLFWNLLASLIQPVVDGGRRRAEVERAEAVLREDAALYRRTVLEAFQEVEDALVNNRATAERIGRLQEQVAATEAGLRVATDRYLQGLTDYLQVLTAQALHVNAQSELLGARRQLISDRIGLVRALGGDWMQAEVEKRMVSGPEPAQT